MFFKFHHASFIKLEIECHYFLKTFLNNLKNNLGYFGSFYLIFFVEYFLANF